MKVQYEAHRVLHQHHSPQPNHPPLLSSVSSTMATYESNRKRSIWVGGEIIEEGKYRTHTTLITTGKRNKKQR